MPHITIFFVLPFLLVQNDFENLQDPLIQGQESGCDPFRDHGKEYFPMEVFSDPPIDMVDRQLDIQVLYFYVL